MLEGGLTWDYAQLLMQNEMAEMLLHTIKGIPISDEKMAVDLVSEVGPAGEFLSHQHTYENFKELSRTKLIDRNPREVWTERGSKDIVERSYEAAIDILENFKPDPLPENIQKGLKDILAEAEAETAELKAKESEKRR
ncbi:MAG: trimethylamine methyltransferase [Desulfitibacter sp. BRH_c19]|nr:MAG: trimethylamine methyltransferase [Desulfitibacter sp. BRH_c19]